MSLLFPDGTHVEAREFHGVIRHDTFTPKVNETVEFFYLTHDLSVEEYARLHAFVDSTLGEPYDWLAVAGFVFGFRSSQPSATRWFCSEWIYTALMTAGRQLLRSDEPWMIAPHEIGLSPLIEPVAAAEPVHFN